MPDILIGDIPFTYTVVKKRVKNLNLRLISSNSLRVTAPLLVSERTIQRFIRDNQLWILLHAQKITQAPDLTQLKAITILGETYQVFIIQSLRDKLTFNHTTRQLIIKSRLLTNAHLKIIISKNLRHFAQKLIAKEIIYFQKQYGFKYGRITLRTQKTRFGSCSSSGNLSFNWQIILFPYDKFQHVILHELAHLTHHDHSPRFWKLLGDYDPNSSFNKRWIKREANKRLLIV